MDDSTCILAAVSTGIIIDILACHCSDLPGKRLIMQTLSPWWLWKGYNTLRFPL